MRGGYTPAAIGVAYFVVMFGVVQVFNIAITEGRTSYPFQFVLLHDLAAISVSSNAAQFPDYITSREGFSMDTVNAKYTTASIGGLVYVDPDHPNVVPALAVTEDCSSDARASIDVVECCHISSDDVLAHRLKVFAQLIGLSRSVTNQYCDTSYNPPEFSIVENPAGNFLTNYFGLFRRPLDADFFLSGILVAVGVRILWICRAEVRGCDAIGILFSSWRQARFCTQAAYFVTAPAADFRYIFWPAIASGLAIIFGVFLLREEKAIPAAEA
jgi:hypothetical protein